MKKIAMVLALSCVAGSVLAQQALKPPKKPEDRKPDRDLLRLQEELSDTLGAQVAIRTNKQGAGKIQIEFGNLDQLEGILQRLR